MKRDIETQTDNGSADRHKGTEEPTSRENLRARDNKDMIQRQLIICHLTATEQAKTYPIIVTIAFIIIYIIIITIIIMNDIVNTIYLC